MVSRPPDLVIIESMLREHFGKNPKPFEPFVDYNRTLDRITVLGKDCTCLEETPILRAPLILIEDMYGSRAYVGFAIDCAHSFCKQSGLIGPGGNVSIGKILDRIESEIVGMRGYCAIARRILAGNGFSNATISVM